jgi:alpha-amylase/alpha-mannosidase (GH57 family)
MNKCKELLYLLLICSLLLSLLSACQPEPDKDILYVNLTWHQHQPLYYKNDEGVYTRPWVRVHATKDYLDMAQKVAAYDDVHVTFNVTPTLIRQLNDIANGAKDIYWVLTEKPVSELTEEEKRFVLERFFDANWNNVIPNYPRYLELLNKRGGTDEAAIDAALLSFADQDFLDLQVWFNLAWFDPTFLAQEPLLALVEKGEGFTDADKEILFTQVLEIVQEVIPYMEKLQDKKQIEVTTTPYAHPILPLIYDNQLALVGDPSALMPDMDFSYPQDAEAHLALSVEMYEDNFGRGVRGLWPGEGAVSQEIVSLVADAGFTYMQTGEPVLAKSLGIDAFTRDSLNFVQEADVLYRPYYVTDEEGDQVAVFFRDGTLSDNVGFVYSGMSGEEAASDLVEHLEGIQADFIADAVEGPHIVSIILDGENAWEYYPNDGNDFFSALYQKFSESEVLKTVTPSEYLKMFPEQLSLDELFPSAWFSANYATWIGETEEAIAWDYLAQVRGDLAAYETGEKTVDPDFLMEAFDFMYLAEGSDWFWWYGDDQDSGQDSYFDEGFRALLAGVYESLGEEVPKFVQVPIIQAEPVAVTQAFGGISTPVIDGEDDEGWNTAAYYEIIGESPVTGLYYTLDEENLFLRIDPGEALVDDVVSLYFSVPNGTGGNAFARDSETVLGFNAGLCLEWTGGDTLNIYQAGDDGWVLAEEGLGQAAAGEGLVEFSIPLTVFGRLSAGDALRLALVAEPEGDVLPVDGPAQVMIPNLGEATIILEVNDPVGDDYGPGSYEYPTDVVFEESVFDVQTFSVGYDEDSLVLTFEFVGPLTNPWGSSLGLSLQTMDVYIDVDPGQGTGARLLLPGRNAALEEGFGWEYAVWAEGWTPQVVQPDPETLEPKEYSEATGGMKVIVDAAGNIVTIRIPLSFLPEGSPMDWAYAAAVLGQEGYPAEGVWRVRNVSLFAAQYVFGGAVADSSHTRIIDLILPEGAEPDQAAILSNYTSLTGSVDSFSLDDFAQIPMLQAGSE